jgi:pyrophosphatase PpaX
MKNNIKLCVFDVDGTLIDTREFIVSAFEYTLAKFGFSVPPAKDIMKIIGKPLEIDYQILTGLSDTTELCKVHRAFQNENQNLVKLFANVEDTLKKLKEQGIKISTLTTRSKITSLISLKNVGIDKYIDLILSIEDVAHPKPAPDGILKSGEFFKIPLSEIFMIGDRDVDVQAGKNANVKTIGVTYGAQGGDISKSNPDFAIGDIKEILNLI